MLTLKIKEEVIIPFFIGLAAGFVLSFLLFMAVVG